MRPDASCNAKLLPPFSRSWWSRPNVLIAEAGLFVHVEFCLWTLLLHDIHVVSCVLRLLPRPQAYNLQAHVVQSYQKLLHKVNGQNKLTSVMGGLAMAYL